MKTNHPCCKLLYSQLEVMEEALKNIKSMVRNLDEVKPSKIDTSCIESSIVDIARQIEEIDINIKGYTE